MAWLSFVLKTLKGDTGVTVVARAEALNLGHDRPSGAQRL
jgi:hypothetical protein